MNDADAPGDGTTERHETGDGWTGDDRTEDGREAGVEAAAVGDADTDASGREDLVVELRGVTKEYRSASETVVALDDVSLTVRPGEFVAVVGPSGSGKSTMLNVLGLLDVPTRGEQYLRGRDVTTLSDEEGTDARKRAIGFVFQDFHLIPTLSATENVELPTLFDDGDASDRARELLRRVGLGDRLDHDPTQLSGGQKQRVAIARSLVNRPALVLADEPTGNLDRETGTTILEEFRRICDDGVAVVAVTHDDLVTEFADRTVELVDGVLREREGPAEGARLATGADGGHETPADADPATRERTDGGGSDGGEDAPATGEGADG